MARKGKKRSGPGRSDRKGISFEQLFDMFPDEQSAVDWFETEYWGSDHEQRYCPRCESAATYRTKSGKPMPYRCRDCKSYFSVRTGTVMESSNLPLKTWVIGIYLMSTDLKGVSSTKLRRDLDVTQKTAWMMAHKIREAMKVTNFGPLDGTLEADETYIGGLEKNKHWDKKLRLGRGAAGKTALAGIRCRENGQVRVRVVESANKRTLKKFVRENAKPGSVLYTDELPSYNGIPGFFHDSVAHSRGEYVRDDVHTNGMESFWAPIKRGYKGTYHKWSRKHTHRYATEFAYRNNCRKLDTIDQMRLLALGMAGRWLPWKLLTR